MLCLLKLWNKMLSSIKQLGLTKAAVTELFHQDEIDVTTLSLACYCEAPVAVLEGMVLLAQHGHRNTNTGINTDMALARADSRMNLLISTRILDISRAEISAPKYKLACTQSEHLLNTTVSLYRVQLYTVDRTLYSCSFNANIQAIVIKALARLGAIHHLFKLIKPDDRAVRHRHCLLVLAA